VRNVKLSKCNIYINYEDDAQLVFNGKTGAFVKLSQSETSLLKNIQENLKCVDGEFIKNLKRGGFIVPDDLEELDVIKVRFENSKWNYNSLGLTIAPTLNCNLRCPYCYEPRDKFEESIKIMPEKVQESLIMFTIDQIKKHEKIKAIGVTWYGGEPLLASDVILSLSKRLMGVADEYDLNTLRQ